MIEVSENQRPYEIRVGSFEWPQDDSQVTHPGKNVLGSLLVMLPWPLLGIAACQSLSLLETSGESVLMFGGVTMILLLPLGLIVSSEWVFSVLVALVWLFALFLPLSFRGKSNNSGLQSRRILVCQSIFSALQAGLGFLLLLGKQC